jgi:hypothetical protein
VENSIGIGVCRSVGTTPSIFCVALSPQDVTAHCWFSPAWSPKLDVRSLPSCAWDAFGVPWAHVLRGGPRGGSARSFLMCGRGLWAGSGPHPGWYYMFSNCFPGSSPAKIRPGGQIDGPEALLHNIEYLMLDLGPIPARIRRKIYFLFEALRGYRRTSSNSGV